MRSEAFWITAGRIGNALILLASLRVMTTLLVPAEYGLLALLTAFQSFAGLILINPVGQYVTRHTHEWHDDRSLGARLHALSRFWLAAGTATGILATVWFAGSRTGYPWQQSLLIGVAVTWMIHWATAQATATSTLVMLGWQKEGVLWQLAGATLGLLFSSLLAYTQPSALAWLAGQGLGAWASYLGAQRALRKETRAGAVTQDARLGAMFSRPDFKRFCMPLVAVTVLLWLEGNGYRFILEQAWAPETFAFLILGLSVPAQMSALLESIVMQLVYPYFFRSVSGAADAAQKCRAVASMIDALWPLYLLWAAFLLVGSPYALRLIADPKYHGAATWLMFGALAELARLTGNIWQLVAQAEKDFAPVLGPFAIGALGVLGAGAAVAVFGLTPALFAALLVGALFAKAVAIVVAMRARMPVPVARWRVALAALILMMVGVASTWLPVEVGSLPALMYLALALCVVAIPMAIHVKTSPAVKYLFAFRLRGER